MKLGSNIKALRKEKGLTQEKMSEILNNSFPDTVNFNKGKISKWENGRETPYLSSAKVLADFFETTVDDLINSDFTNSIYAIYNKLEEPRQAKVYNFAEHQLEEQNKVKEDAEIIYITSKLSAGTGIIDLDPTYKEEMEFNGYVPKHDLAFLVDGNSMTPTFEDGEVVFVEKTPDIHSGQFVAVQVNEEAFIKKAYIEDDRLRLVSLNKDYEDIYADGSDDIRIIGKVIL